MSWFNIINFNNMFVFALGFVIGFFFPLIRKFNKFLDEKNKEKK